MGLIWGTGCPLSLMPAITKGRGIHGSTPQDIANTCNKHKNMDYDYIKVVILGFLF
jgi:hypothetical protein